MIGKGRCDEDNDPIDLEFLQLFERSCAQIGGYGDHERRRIVPRGDPRCPGHLEQRRQAWATRQVDAVGQPACQIGHFRPKTADNDWRRRVGPKEPTNIAHSP